MKELLSNGNLVPNIFSFRAEFDVTNQTHGDLVMMNVVG